MRGEKKNYIFRKEKPERKHVIKTGQPPGALHYTGDKKDTKPLITAIQYKEDRVVEHTAESLIELKDKLESGYTTWINIDGVHDSRIINDCGSNFQIENLSMEDIMNVESRPKFEEFEDYIFIIIKDMHCTLDGDFGMEQISMVVKENLLITFQEEVGDVFDGIRGRIRGGTSKIRSRGIDYLAYALIDAIIDNYIVITETFDHYLDDLEDTLYGSTHRSQLNQIKDAKKHYNTLKRIVHPMKDVVYNMYRTEHKLVTKRTHMYTRDLYDHVTSIDDTISQSRDKVYGLMGIYQSGTNNTMNTIMKTLTIVSAIFMALSLIAGIYGMNFNTDASKFNMPELNWMYGYPAALGLMAVTAIGLIIYFRFKKWL